ncbi:MAG: hypothetical protein ACRYGG_22660, partial [Janthinobacterium lividum]
MSVSTGPSTPLAKDVDQSARNHATSNDSAIGGILVHHHETKTNGLQYLNDPLPPEVTTVEGSGYHSDTESVLSTEDGLENRDGHSQNAQDSSLLDSEATNSLSPAHAETSSTLPAATNVEVPSIAVQPATPGRDDLQNSKHTSWLGMPGDFPRQDSARNSIESVSGSAVKDESIEVSPSTVGIAEPEPEPVAAYHDHATPVIGQVADNIRQQIAIVEEDEESDDTGNSIYSDAAEDQSDLEGDGFGSINAIVESPAPVAKKRPVSPPPKSKARPQTQHAVGLQYSQPSPDEGWDKAQSYWSGLSSSRKAELEENATASTPSKADAQPSKQPGAKKQTAETQPIAANLVTKQALQTRSKAPQMANIATTSDPITKTAQTTPSLKKSLRDGSSFSHHAPSGASAPSQLRSSMRNGAAKNQARQSNSMRDANKAPITARSGPAPSTTNGYTHSEPKGTLQKKTRPVSSVNLGPSGAPVNGNGRPRAASAGGPAAMSMQSKRTTAPPVPALKRQVSNGSDSDSSFKRARANRATNEGKYSMKRSMRAASVAERPRSTFERSQPQSSNFSVRSLSPTGNAWRPGSMGTMRASLRQNVEPERAKSPTRSLFGRKSKA